MKTFLEVLEAELKKRNIATNDILEIMSDHKEMIETAIQEGLTEEEVYQKFGDPIELAKELSEMSEKEIKVEKVPNEYTVFHSFPLAQIKEAEISLVNEDIKVQVHDSETLEVYAKRLHKPELYDCKIEDEVFTLRRKSNSFSFFKSNSKVKFRINIPKSLYLAVFHLQVVNADCDLTGLKADAFKVRTTNGDFDITQIETKAFELSAVNGDIVLKDTTADNVKISAVNGDMKFERVTVQADLDIHSVSGDVKLEECEATTTYFKTVSGDLKGKEFYTKEISLKSVSGDVDIRNNDESKPIVVKSKKTLSGDVKIK